MDNETSKILDWAYHLSMYLNEDFEVESYNDYEIEEAWHDYTRNENAEVKEIIVGVELICDGWDTNPLKLIEEVSNCGFEFYSANVEWDLKGLRLSFKYEL